MARIAFFEIGEEWVRERLTRAVGAHEVVFVHDPLTRDTAELAARAEAVSVFIHSSVGASVLAALPAVRIVATRSTGFDHIDLAACRAKDVTVTNVPRYGENTVAEHTFGLILNLCHKIHRAYLNTRGGDFSLTGLEGADLRGKTLGVIGAGRIGLHVVRIARAFEMTVLVHDAQPQPILEDVMGFRYVPLDALLATADIVSLHAPLVAATRGLIDRERFARMKPGALFVNTARGGLVDTDALLWALDTGRLSGAALDVLEGEEMLSDESYMFRTGRSMDEVARLLRVHKLLERDNVLFTPHIAWFSREARIRILDTTLENLSDYLAGKAPRDRVAA